MEVKINRKLLVSARYQKGMSTPALAKAADVSLSTVISIECGRRLPSPKTLLQLCNVLGLEVKDVIEIVA